MPSVACANQQQEFRTQGSHALLSKDRVDVLASTFREGFRNLTSIGDKEDMQWTMSRIAHQQSRIPLISEAMHMMVESLEQEEAQEPVVELGERDVCVGRSPKAYVQLTTLFVEEYVEAIDMKNVLKRIFVTLKAEGFRFLEKQKTRGNWQPMSVASAIKIIRGRMNRNCRQKNQNSEQRLEPLDLAPGPFTERNPFLPNGEPGSMSIIVGKVKEVKGNPTNAAYRKMVAEVASAFKDATS